MNQFGQAINHSLSRRGGSSDKAHGGTIKVETKEDEGAEFIIQLPINKVSLNSESSKSI